MLHSQIELYTLLKGPGLHFLNFDYEVMESFHDLDHFIEVRIVDTKSGLIAEILEAASESEAVDLVQVHMRTSAEIAFASRGA